VEVHAVPGVQAVGNDIFWIAAGRELDDPRNVALRSDRQQRLINAMVLPPLLQTDSSWSSM